MAKQSVGPPGGEEPTLDVEKLRKFLSVPKGKVLEAEADCTCGPSRQGDRVRTSLPTEAHQRGDVEQDLAANDNPDHRRDNQGVTQPVPAEP